MASNASYSDIRSMAFSRSIMLLLLIIYEYHVVSVQVTFQSYANSCCIELVAWKQYPASFHLLDLICYGLFLYLRIGVISARLGLANGLDDPVTY